MPVIVFGFVASCSIDDPDRGTPGPSYQINPHALYHPGSVPVDPEYVRPDVKEDNQGPVTPIATDTASSSDLVLNISEGEGEGEGE